MRLLLVWALLACAGGALIPEPDVQIHVVQKPFLCQRKTKNGDMLLLHFEGFLESNGTQFYSTYKNNNDQPVWFTLGIREGIKGWDKGLKDMCAGEKRKLIVPPALAYGKEGKGKIPPESTLIFNISLMEIRNGPRSHESFQEMDLNDDWKLSKAECTYLTIDQAAKTHSVILSKPTWIWGAEMGANEYGLCIGNAEVITKQTTGDTALLLGTDLVRLGLERGTSAREALNVITSLLEEHGQGGSSLQTDSRGFHSAFLMVDREEAWVLETVGKFWAAEKITDGIRCICNHLSLKTHMDLEHPELQSHARGQGWWNGEEEFNFADVFSEHREGDDCLGKETVENEGELMTVESMINLLRNKSSGICVDTDTFLTTASAVSVIPRDDKWPCIHFLTGTPDPSRSIFKPFIFVEDVKTVPKVQASYDHSQGKHELYEAHQRALSLMNEDKEEGDQLLNIMLDLEKQGLDAMEDLLSSSNPIDSAEVADLFYDCVDTEIKFYK